MDRIGALALVSFLVLEESGKIAHSRETEAQNKRVLCAVDQLIDPPRLKSGWQAELLVSWRCGTALGAGTKTPFCVRDRNTWILLLRPHCQCWQKAVGEWRPIVDADRWIARVAHEREPPGGQVQCLGGAPDDELAAHHASDW